MNANSIQKACDYYKITFVCMEERGVHKDITLAMNELFFIYGYMRNLPTKEIGTLGITIVFLVWLWEPVKESKHKFESHQTEV